VESSHLAASGRR